MKLAACLLALCVAAQAETVPRSTIRVGVWTLWHDHEAIVTPVPEATLRECESCRAHGLRSITLRAEGAGLTWTEQDGQTHSASVILLAGSYRLDAHGESLRLAWPLKITAQHGALLLVATLPIESYVELAVAAESGAADSPESRRRWRWWRAALR